MRRVGRRPTGRRRDPRPSRRWPTTGCRRGADDGPLGARLRRPRPRRPRRRPTTELTEALAVRHRQPRRSSYILPPLWGLAEVALQAGDPERGDRRCAGTRSSGPGPSDERLLLAPFVVTGVRARTRRPDARRRGGVAGRLPDAPRRRCRRSPVPRSSTGAGSSRWPRGRPGSPGRPSRPRSRGWDATAAIWEATWARLDLANCLVRSNRFADAVALAVEAGRPPPACESRLLAERADALLRMARGRVVGRRAVAAADGARVRGRAARSPRA